MWSAGKGGVDIGAYEYNSQPAVLSVPANISTTSASSSLTISWEEVSGSLFYKVFSSDDNLNFEEDFYGVFNNCTWSVPISTSKKFYRVVAVN